MPKLTGRTLEVAVGLLHEKELELSRAMPLAEGPRDRITGQVPGAGELVRSGSPVDVFLDHETPVDQRVEPVNPPSGDETAPAGTPRAGARPTRCPICCWTRPAISGS